MRKCKRCSNEGDNFVGKKCKVCSSIYTIKIESKNKRKFV